MTVKILKYANSSKTQLGNPIATSCLLEVCSEGHNIVHKGEKTFTFMLIVSM